MDAGTVTKPAELSMDDLGEYMASMNGIAGPKLAFKQNQISAKIAMFDSEPGGIAIISQTTNGWMTRTALNKRQALRLANALIMAVAGQL